MQSLKQSMQHCLKTMENNSYSAHTQSSDQSLKIRNKILRIDYYDNLIIDYSFGRETEW